jgi:hypothetical protein
MDTTTQAPDAPEEVMPTKRTKRLSPSDKLVILIATVLAAVAIGAGVAATRNDNSASNQTPAAAPAISLGPRHR